MLQIQQAQGIAVTVHARPKSATPTASADPLAALESLGTTLKVNRGEDIYLEGDPAEYCYRLVEGCVRTVKILADGSRQVGDILFAGDFFGFELTGDYYFSAQAASAVTLRRYARRAVVERAQFDPGLAGHLHTMTARALHAARQQMTRLCRKSASERMASFLLEMADRSHATGGHIDLLMSRSDIADYLGLVIETVSRMFSQFKQDGIIAMSGANRIKLVDREALEDLQGDM